MAHRGIYSRVLVNEFDFSGVSTDLGVEINGNSLDATTFQATTKENVAAPTESTISQSGFFAYDSANTDQNLEAALKTYLETAQANVSALILTDLAACPSYTKQNCTSASMSIEAAVADLLKVSGDWGGDPIRRGLRAFGKHSTWSNGIISATGGKPYIDTGAQGLNGGIGILHIHDITGTATNAAIDLEADSDTGFGTALTKATFTFSAVGIQIVNFTGVTNRYLRANCTTLGGATDFTVTLLAVVRGVTHNY